MYTRVFDKIRDAEEFAVSSNIKKENIVSLSQINSGQFLLIYYAE